MLAKRGPRWAPGKSQTATTTGWDPQSMVDEVVPGDGQCFKVTYDKGIGLREGPDIYAKRTGRDLVYGEIFEVKTEVRRGGRRYFELIDGRGWAFDWTEVNGERVELVEMAALLYTMVFPNGVDGVEWSTDYQMRFTKVKAFKPEAASALIEAGMGVEDILVMIDKEPVAGMPFSQVLNRLWATRGAQPGTGNYYRVITNGPFGIGIREDADIESQRTGEDLVRGTVFEVDEVRPTEDGPTYLHLADGRGWVFDMSPVDPENPSVQNLAEVDGPCSVTMWRGKPEELAQTIGLRFKTDGGGEPFVMTVLEDGQPTQQINVMPGGNLRQTLVEEGFQVYQDINRVFNCKSRQLCGTCVLEVLEGNENLTAKSINEKNAMRYNPDNYRLCCNIDVYGDVTVRLRPPDVTYTAGTS